MTNELKRFTHENIADARLTCLKLLVILEKSLQGKKTDYDGEMEEIYVYSIVNELPEALTEIERLQSQLAARDALIERMVAKGNKLIGSIVWDGWEMIEGEWDSLVSEWQAMKGGAE